MCIYRPEPPKSKVYRFGAVWFWKCNLYMCHGGRDRTQRGAFSKALKHVQAHRELRV